MRRLRAMSADEVLARAGRTARHRLDDVAWRWARPLWARGWHGPKRLGAAEPAEPLGFLTASRADGLRERFPDEAARLLAAADDALAGRVRFFGYPGVELARPVDYGRDALTGARWPERHGKLIDYRAAPADPKWIWELNRLQYLPLLAAAFILSGDERYARGAVARMTAWISQEPPGRGIAWANGFEAGLRAISLALTFDALRASGVPTVAETAAIRGSLWQHARWIKRDPATHSSANNHRIGELAGLATIALLVPELPEAAAWAREALDGLAEEADRQILPDGLGAEQAFAYTLFIVDLISLVVALCDVRGTHPPEPLVAALGRAADALAAQLGDDEPSPAYGDADDGRAFVLDAEELRQARPVAASLAARLGHPGARRVAGSLDPAAWWLFGPEGAQRFAETGGASRPGSLLLGSGGLVLLRRAGSRVLVDVGPLGFGSLAAHGHADALQVTLARGGEDLVVDPGVGSYFGRPAWREAFRGTRFHPTVAVDGLDQSVAGGPFLWTRHAGLRLLHLDLDETLVVAEHDGYSRLADPVRHRRAVVLLPSGGLLVHDRLEAAEEHAYRQSWPLAPDLEVEEKAGQYVEARRAGEPRLLLAIASPAEGSLHVSHGETDPLEGWWSARLESAVPSWAVRWEGKVAGPAEITALLLPLDEVAPQDPRLRTRRTDEGIEATFETPEGAWRYLFDLGVDAPRVARVSGDATRRRPAILERAGGGRS
jgi:uncharacterized heparinase superfamily protein